MKIMFGLVLGTLVSYALCVVLAGVGGFPVSDVSMFSLIGGLGGAFLGFQERAEA